MPHREDREVGKLAKWNGIDPVYTVIRMIAIIRHLVTPLWPHMASRVKVMSYMASICRAALAFLGALLIAVAATISVYPSG